ncbi:MAG: M1 family peptidase [Methylocystaceae bacterium]|nr:M1 family peptidase [Methylocystaceae bacterium]
MKRFLLVLFATILCSLPAQAVTHFDLDVRIDLEKRQIIVRGKSDKPAVAPRTQQEAKNFDYHFDLGAIDKADTWRAGPFKGKENLYLPVGWHPQTTDLITYNVKVTSGLPTILPGKITEEHHTDQSYQARFTMERPTEGMPLFSGPYQISELISGNIRLRSYFYEGMESLSDRYLKRTAQYITRFEKQIGPYPFAGFHIVASPIPAGYGFAGLTYMGARVLALPFIQDSSLGHEILHNYWGNGVFPDYQTGNWAEGLTTYMADYMTAEQKSAEKARDMRLSWLRDYAALPDGQDQPVSRFKAKHGQASQVIGYNKSAFIFHMLRQKIGDGIFFKALRHFWQNHAFKMAGWINIQDSFEQVSQTDLNDFFQQWVNGTGAPGFKNFSAQARHQQGKGWAVTTRVVQNTPTFKTHLPLSVGTAKGLHYHQAQLSNAMSQSTFWVKDRPNAVSLDPDFNLFRKLGPNEAPPILRDVMLSQDVGLVLLSPSLKDTALPLANRLVEGGLTGLSDDSENRPFIMIGLADDVAQYLHTSRLPPHNLGDMGASAQVWAGKTHSGAPYMVISVVDAESLKALMRPLSHYGRRSALQFNGSKAIFKSNGQTRPIAVPIN